jgi:hypothetical protein
VKRIKFAVFITNFQLYFLEGAPPTPKQTKTRTRTAFISQRQRGGARHCGAPMLRRYAATSAFLRSMAYLSAV